MNCNGEQNAKTFFGNSYVFPFTDNSRKKEKKKKNESRD